MFRFASEVTLQLGSAAYEAIGLAATVDQRPVPFVLDTSGDSSTLYLPVSDGSTFSLGVTNYTHALAAIPVRVGDGKNWTNLYIRCPITDPAQMPSDGGMWEVNQGGYQAIKGYAVPTGFNEFRVAPAGDPRDGAFCHNMVEVYYRAPVDPSVVLSTSGSTIPGAVARSERSAPSGVTVVQGEFQKSGRVTTGLKYVEEAHLIAAIHVIDRRDLVEILALTGFGLDAFNASDWDLGEVRSRYPQLMQDITNTI